jgi:hypothetical protein
MIAALGSGHWSKLDSGKLWSADGYFNPPCAGFVLLGLVTAIGHNSIKT